MHETGHIYHDTRISVFFAASFEFRFFSCWPLQYSSSLLYFVDVIFSCFVLNLNLVFSSWQSLHFAHRDAVWKLGFTFGSQNLFIHAQSPSPQQKQRQRQWLVCILLLCISFFSLALSSSSSILLRLIFYFPVFYGSLSSWFLSTVAICCRVHVRCFFHSMLMMRTFAAIFFSCVPFVLWLCKHQAHLCDLFAFTYAIRDVPVILLRNKGSKISFTALRPFGCSQSNAIVE